MAAVRAVAQALLLLLAARPRFPVAAQAGPLQPPSLRSAQALPCPPQATTGPPSPPGALCLPQCRTAGTSPRKSKGSALLLHSRASWSGALRQQQQPLRRHRLRLHPQAAAELRRCGQRQHQLQARAQRLQAVQAGQGWRQLVVVMRPSSTPRTRCRRCWACWQGRGQAAVLRQPRPQQDRRLRRLASAPPAPVAVAVQRRPADLGHQHHQQAEPLLQLQP